MKAERVLPIVIHVMTAIGNGLRKNRERNWRAATDEAVERVLRTTTMDSEIYEQAFAERTRRRERQRRIENARDVLPTG